MKKIECNRGDSYYHSYINQNSIILDLYNSETIILFLNFYGGAIWLNSHIKENDGNSLIFYKYNKKHKKYESIIKRNTNSYLISKFDQSNLLITYDKKYEYSSHADYFLRKIDINKKKFFMI